MSEENKEKIAAVVVTYNRKQLLGECLNALLKQSYPLDALYIIDNASTDGTPEYLMEKGFIDKQLFSEKEPSESLKSIPLQSHQDRTLEIHYVQMHENTGGAGGFHEGVKRGYEAGFDWLWLMDDDAEPEQESLLKLSEYFNFENVVALCSLVFRLNSNISDISRGRYNLKKMFPMDRAPISHEEFTKKFIEIDFAAFVGLLVNKNAIKSIGFPIKEFFIHSDDNEYCLRLRKLGKILLIPESVIIHKEEQHNNLQVKNLFIRKSKRLKYEKLWLSYYGRRNLTWVWGQYTNSRKNFYVSLLKLIIKELANIIICDDHKLKRIIFLLNAYLDGIRGKFDNKKPQIILYGRSRNAQKRLLAKREIY